MLALVTQADGTSRGQPWVSYALAAAVLAGYAMLQSGSVAEQRDEAESLRAEAIAYFQQRPYLELDERLLAYAGGAAAVEGKREAFFAERRARGRSLMPKSIQQRTQRKFDAMVAGVFDAEAALPARRHGVIDTATPVRNWATHFAVHETPLALLVSMAFLLLLGIALEEVWGHLRFAAFALVSITSGAGLYASLHGGQGIAWVGASGLVAALVGAYFVQSLRWTARLLGAVSMPGWLMAIAWLGAEYAGARGARPANLAELPWLAHGALLCWGAAVALVMRQLGHEQQLRRRDEKKSEVLRNPVLDRALAAHEAGRSEDAFVLLVDETDANPDDRDLSVAFWSVASACGRPREAVPGMLRVIQEDLRARRRGEVAAAMKELLPVLDDADLDPALWARVGEALLDEGDANEGLLALGHAVDGEAGLPSAIALRVVRVARDHDAGLTARAAARALDDPTLDPAQRLELEPLSADVAQGVRTAPAEEPAHAPPAPPQPAIDEDDLDRVDPDAFASSSLEDETSPEAEASETEMERWNDPGLVEDLSEELAAGDGASQPAGDAYDPTSYGTVDLGGEEAAVPAPAGGDPPSDSDTTAPLSQQDQAEIAASHGDHGADLGAGEALDETDELEATDELGLDSSAPRRLQLLQAQPLSLDESGFAVEVEGRGKTRLTWDRIEALAVGAVAGLGGRPVLVVDLVMNWMSLADEPLRVVRLRSDRFDPRALIPEADGALAALQSLLQTLLERTDATPLPDADGARGAPFARFEDLASYQRDVLMVSEDG